MCEDRLAFRKDTFQQGITIAEIKCKRYETAVTLRRHKRQIRAIQFRSVPSECEPPTASMLHAYPSFNSSTTGQRLGMVLEFLAEKPTSEIRAEDLIVLKPMVKDVDSFEAAMASPVPSKLVECCRECKDPKVLEQALWILTNIACGPRDLTMQLVELRAAQAACPLVVHPEIDVSTQAVWLLGNLVADINSHSILIFKLGIIEKLNLLIKRRDEGANSCAAWMLDNLFSNPPTSKEFILAAFPLLTDLIILENEDGLANTLRVFGYIVERLPASAAKSIDSRYENAILKGLTSQSFSLNQASLRALGSLAYSFEPIVVNCLNKGVLDMLHELLRTKGRAIQKTTLWAISNILGSHASLKLQVLHHPIYSTMMQLASNCEPPIAAELLYCLSNALNDVDMAISLELIDKGAIQVIVAALSDHNPEVLLTALKLLQGIFEIDCKANKTQHTLLAIRLEECEGMNKLNSLMMMQHPAITKQVKFILDAFLEIEQEDKTDLLEPTPVFSFS